MKRSSIIIFYFLCFCFCNNTQAQYIRSKHESLVNAFAKQAAYKLMKQICPNTGKDDRVKIIEWVFDEYKNEYEIKMEAYWRGSPWAFADTQDYEIDGILTVSTNGNTTSFNQSYENRAVKVTKQNISWLKGTVFTLGALYIVSESNKN